MPHKFYHGRTGRVSWLACGTMLFLCFSQGYATQKSFSKLKLRISYLRSTMCQQRLHEFVLLSIEKEFQTKPITII